MNVDSVGVEGLDAELLYVRMERQVEPRDVEQNELEMQ